MLLQSTDLHDIGLMANGVPLKTAGNSGAGTYVFEIGQRTGNSRNTLFSHILSN